MATKKILLTYDTPSLIIKMEKETKERKVEEWHKEEFDVGII